MHRAKALLLATSRSAHRIEAGASTAPREMHCAQAHTPKRGAATAWRQEPQPLLLATSRSAHRIEAGASTAPRGMHCAQAHTPKRGAATAWRQEPQPPPLERRECTARQRSLCRRGMHGATAHFQGAERFWHSGRSRNTYRMECTARKRCRSRRGMHRAIAQTPRRGALTA
jgi:hypothetical protein